MTLLRGLADDLPLMAWLRDHIWPAESKHVSPEFVYDGTLLACAEMLRGGVACFNEMYFYPEAAARAALDCGMRAALGIIAFEFPTSYAADADDYIAKGLAARDALREEPLLSFCMAPHAPYTVSDRTFAKLVTIAEELDLPIHTHLHETGAEIDESLARYKARPLERLRIRLSPRPRCTARARSGWKLRSGRSRRASSPICARSPSKSRSSAPAMTRSRIWCTRRGGNTYRTCGSRGNPGSGRDSSSDS